MNTIYVGYDPREHLNYEVLLKSIDKLSRSSDINVIPLKMDALKHAGLFTRKQIIDKGQRWDLEDGKPCSTEFSFTRFLVPALQQYEGWALFMDCDMYFRSDPNEVFDKADPTKAVQLVRHYYIPEETIKMDNQIQEQYSRKNWSSFVLWNCGHPANLKLTPEVVNSQTGHWLHNFSWLGDEDIGGLREEWNWLDHWSPCHIKAKNVHFTTGGPFFTDWAASNATEQMYANEWNQLRLELTKEKE